MPMCNCRGGPDCCMRRSYGPYLGVYRYFPTEPVYYPYQQPDSRSFSISYPNLQPSQIVPAMRPDEV